MEAIYRCGLGFLDEWKFVRKEVRFSVFLAEIPAIYHCGMGIRQENSNDSLAAFGASLVQLAPIYFCQLEIHQKEK